MHFGSHIILELNKKLPPLQMQIEKIQLVEKRSPDEANEKIRKHEVLDTDPLMAKVVKTQQH